MTIFRRLLSLTMAACLIFSFGLTALAADYEAADFDQLKYAFSAAENAADDTAVNVTITDSIDFDSTPLSTQEGYSYSIGSSADHTLVNAAFNGSGSVEINADIVGDNGQAALTTSGEVAVEVTGNISSDTYITDGLAALDESKVTVNGNVCVNADETVAVFADGTSSVTVNGNVTGNGTNGVAVGALNNSTIDVQDSVHASGISYYGILGGDYSTISVGAGVSVDSTLGDAVIAKGNTTIAINGDVKAGDGDPDAVDYSDPEGYSDGGYGISARDSATVSVGGSVYGGNSFGTYGTGGNGIEAYGSAKVFVGGDVTGGNVIADPETPAENEEAVSRAGNAITMESTNNVHVLGDAIGGSTNGDQGKAGDGLYIEYVFGTPGSAHVGGSAMGGDGPGRPSVGIYLDDDTDGELTLEEAQEFAVSVGYTSGIDGEDFAPEIMNQLIQDIVDSSNSSTQFNPSDMSAEDDTPDEFWSEVQLRLRRAKEGETLTIDIGHRSHIPTHLLKAAQEKGITLVIQWRGGEDITVTSATTYDETRYSVPLADLAK